MKNDFGTKDSSSRMRGFYMALLSCVGILVIVAVIVNYNNYTAQKDLQNENASYEEPEIRNVNVGTQDSIEDELGKYLDPSADGAESNLSARNPKTTSPTSTSDTKLNPESPEAQKANTPEETAKPQDDKVSEKPEDSSKVDENKVPENKSDDKRTELDSDNIIKAEADVAQENAVQEEVAQEDESQEKAEAETSSFAATGKMNWPVVGEILMDYSVENVVYDETLELFRTNDNIAISSYIGAEVKASADGVVKSVDNDERNGRMIVIDNGDGWITTYSQLQDDVLVKEGDVVRAGQIIGSVGSPTKYNVLLGSHLGFKVAKNDQTVDPKSILVQ